MRQLCYSLFCLFSIRVTSEVGWATPKKKKKIEEGKKKRGNLSTQLTHPHPPSPPLSSSFPSLFLVSPILCEKASVVRAQSVEVAGFWTMPQPEPQDSWVHWEEHISGESKALARKKKLYCDFQLQDRRSEWSGATQKTGTKKDRERWVLSTSSRWRHNTKHTWNYNCRKHTPNYW